MNSTREINAFRPSSSTIQKNSHLIKKPTGMPISTTSSTVMSDSSIASASHSQPVIIHAHSPKVMHIQACDFMAIVQKFTGFSTPSNDDNNTNLTCKDDDPPVNKKRKISVGQREEKLVESSLNDNRQLKPQQWPSVTPIANVGFNPFSNAMWFGHGFTSEIFELPNSIYRFAEMPEMSSISNINSTSSRLSDV
ncbi:VQ motif-containing protein 20-like [Phalaenopsis equestris]|uniref:VQ motif-containing protein 20-like n=1 Tax=Phalaenopsis equestris TaxID=78828 RepID=UPI0009E2F276|nr:VQ motif-containing protein 20-like [Phalaenopsis equestris]